MNDIPIGVLLICLLILLALSAFFSGSETALLTLNRYRLLHRAKAGHRGAISAQNLLQRPDRLIGFILLGNNFVNIMASSLGTIIALRLVGESGIALAAGVLTLLVLIFSEVAPKTVAALQPDRIAYPAARIILPLLKVFYPVVWVVNTVVNLLLRSFGIEPGAAAQAALSKDELRTVVAETGSLIPERYQNMLLSVLDLESATVEDIMIPRNEIVGIDLDDPWESILGQIRDTRHTRLPVYRKHIDKVFGLLHLRKALIEMSQPDFSKDALAKIVDKIHFVPGNMALHKLLHNFQREKLRFGLVVDEYGDVQGLVTLEDLLQEILGEFSADSSEVIRQKDGSFLVDAGIGVRELNRVTGWALPVEGPKTLSGLIIEYLETIPETGTSLKLGELHLEITRMDGNVIRQVRFLS